MRREKPPPGVSGQRPSVQACAFRPTQEDCGTDGLWPRRTRWSESIRGIRRSRFGQDKARETIATLRAENERLWQEIEARREAEQELRVVILNLSQRIPALGSPQAEESAPVSIYRVPEQAKKSWWRRLWGR